MTPSRVAIIDGVRTPFLKSWTDFGPFTALDLLNKVISEIVYRIDFPLDLLDEVITGCVFCPPYYPNIARESIIALGLPKQIPGYTLSKACSSSLQAISSATDGIMAGRYRAVIASGSESTSNIPLLYSSRLVNSLMKFQKARSAWQRLQLLRKIPFSQLVPRMPKINEYSTGQSMGEHAEEMAKINQISRREQDEYALNSHQKAAQAQKSGKFDEELVTVYCGTQYEPVRKDNGIRAEASLDQMAALKPVFDDKRYGSITAANASPLTDGASAVLLMSEDLAKSLGLKPKGYIRAHAYAALDPRDQMLLGNVYSIPKVLKAAKLKLSEIDLVEMHEAFASQILSTLKVMKSRKDLQKTETPLGEIDPARFNVNGGSIALGHPFGATACRLVTTCLNELKRQQKQYGLVAVCAAGGMSGAMILERE
ncbi:MAG: acetyl-CoA C-acyltransferase [Planctomycetota bacterium]